MIPSLLIIFLCLQYSISPIQPQVVMPPCIEEYEILFSEDSSKSRFKSRSLSDSREALVKYAQARTLESDEIDRGQVKLEKFQMGESSIYLKKEKTQSVHILDQSIQVAIDGNIIQVGMNNKILEKYFPLNYKERQDSYARSGIEFLRLQLCHPQFASRPSDGRIVISWNKKNGKLVEILISH